MAFGYTKDERLHHLSSLLQGRSPLILPQIPMLLNPPHAPLLLGNPSCAVAVPARDFAGANPPKSEKKFIELFAGIGLVHESLQELGWQAVLANDHHPKKSTVYRTNFPEVLFDPRDVALLDPLSWPEATLVSASFPCVDLSQAGNRQGISGPRSSLVRVFLDKVGRLAAAGRKPEFLLVENVPNLLSIHGGSAIDEIMSLLAGMAYGFDVLQIDAKHFTPQSRNRVFIVAVDLVKHPLRPSPLPDDSLHRHKVKDAYHRHPTLPWFFFNLPPLPRRTLRLCDIVEAIPSSDKSWWDQAQTDYFWKLLEAEHRTLLQNLLREGSIHVFSAVRRLRRRRIREQIFNLRFDGLASCLRTPGGGSSTQYMVFAEDGKLRGRRITPLESARLQGICLPESRRQFTLTGTDTEVRFALGDAVCVPAVQWVVRHTIDSLCSREQIRSSLQPAASPSLLLF